MNSNKILVSRADATITTGKLESHYIGDFPDFPTLYDPYHRFSNHWIIPQPIETIYPNLLSLTASGTQMSLFRADPQQSRFKLSLDVPGIKKENLSLIMNGPTLVISGKRSDTDANLYQTYNIPLDYDISPENVEATVVDGVLIMYFQKQDKPSNKITIKDV